MENKEDRLSFRRRGNDAVKNMLLGINEDSLKAEEIVLLPIDLVDPLESFLHPFEKSLHKGVEELAEKIRVSGVLEPLMVRQKPDQRYEVLAGHRRRLASIMAGLEFLPAIIRNCDDDTAKIIVTDTNLGQREEILQSEKAAAYQMQMEALRNQGKRSDLVQALEQENNFVQTLHEVTSLGKVADINGTSARQVAYYLRLNKLIEPLLYIVDNKEISFGAAVELSYLSVREQTWVCEIMQESGLSVMVKTATALRVSSQEGSLITKGIVEAIINPAMNEEKEMTKKPKPIYKPVLKNVEGYFKKLPPDRAEKLELIHKIDLEEVIKIAIERYLDSL